MKSKSKLGADMGHSKYVNEPVFYERHVVDFGNFLLKKCKKMLYGTYIPGGDKDALPDGVTHADLANWKEEFFRRSPMKEGPKKLPTVDPTELIEECEFPWRKSTEVPDSNGYYFAIYDRGNQYNGRMGERVAIYYNGQEWISVDQYFEWLDI